MNLLKNVCGPVLEAACGTWCNEVRLCEDLMECGTGSFIQMKVQWDVSDLIRLDLQNALDRYIPTLHLPVKRLRDNQVMLQVFVPQGCTCYSSTQFACLSEFQHWQATLLSAGSRAYPTREASTMLFLRVHHTFEEAQALHDPVTKYFVMADTSQQEGFLLGHSPRKDWH